MNREEITLLGFEIVSYAGEARSKLIDALKAAQNGDFEKAEELVESANSSIVEAHHAQTSLLQKEAAGEDLAY
ncbi:PTS lactose/cellobiose transporter subunit IIA, partial [Streptococcus agalactiae]